MKDIILQGTDTKPQVRFTADGQLLLKGRSFCEDPRKLYQPIIQWCNKIDAKAISFDVRLDYINTSSTKCLYDLLEALDNNNAIANIDINWYYEEEDEDMYDLGRIFKSDCSRANFSFFGLEEMHL